MVKFFHNFHLTLHRLSAVWLHQLGFLVDLDRDFLVKWAMQSETNDGIGTLTDSLANKVVVKVLDWAIGCAKLILSGLPIFQILQNLVLRVPILFLGICSLSILFWRSNHITSVLWVGGSKLVVVVSLSKTLFALLIRTTLGENICVCSTRSFTALAVECNLAARLSTQVLCNDWSICWNCILVVLHVVHLDLANVRTSDSAVIIGAVFTCRSSYECRLPLLYHLLARISHKVGHSQNFSLIVVLAWLAQQILRHLLVKLLSIVLTLRAWARPVLGNCLFWRSRLAEKSWVLTGKLMRGEEIVGCHISSGSSHYGLLVHICRALSSSWKLEEVVYLLSVLLVVRVTRALLCKLGIANFAVSRYRSIWTHALLGQTNHADAVVHFIA